MKISVPHLTGLILLAGGAVLNLVLPAHANVCLNAAAIAARDSGVPVAVLQAISMTETGRKTGGQVLPWPWTVNMEGKGHWFDSRDAALAFAETNFGNGARSFDIGCFQINFKWHGAAFDSIADMFDPVTNAQYAADFLRQLHQETADWDMAAGAYHSRTEEHASRYRRIFGKHLAALTDPLIALTVAAAMPAITVRANAFPLLQGGEMRGLASLVPLTAGTRPFFAAN